MDADNLPRPVSMTSGCIDARCDAVISNTSAPCAASVRPHTGPAMMRVRSRTLTPASGRWAAAEQGAHPVAVMRQIGVQAQPTAVAAAIEPHDRVVILGRRLSIDPQVPFAAEFDGGAAHVDADTLGAAGAQMPQFARCQRSG